MQQLASTTAEMDSETHPAAAVKAGVATVRTKAGMKYQTPQTATEKVIITAKPCRKRKLQVGCVDKTA